MSLGRRCDEIVRLIDEALVSTGDDTATAVDVSPHPSGASLAGGGEPTGGARRRRHRAEARRRTLHEDGFADL
jgi:hypothetical protein